MNSTVGIAPIGRQECIARFESIFFLLLETEKVYQEWKRLIGIHAVTGMEAHDTRIVAAMVVHGIENIITFNVDDFEGYEDIQVIHPEEF